MSTSRTDPSRAASSAGTAQAELSEPAAQEFRILAVCTGNLCRSPMIERVLRHELARGTGPTPSRVLVASAGTMAQPGSFMHPQTARTLEAMHVDPRGFTTTLLTADLVRQADLVVTAAREHRAAVVTLDPAASRRTFTLGELVRLITGMSLAEVRRHPAERAAAMTALAVSRRGLVAMVAPERDDLPDPLGQGTRAFADCGRSVAELLWEPVRMLRGEQ